MKTTDNCNTPKNTDNYQTVAPAPVSAHRMSLWAILAIPLLIGAGIYFYYMVWPSFYPPPLAITTIISGIGLAAFLIIGIIAVRALKKRTEYKYGAY